MPPFPVEIFERIIDHLWWSAETLQACALVCRSWYARSRLHLLGRLILRKRTHVALLAKFVRTHPELEKMIGAVAIRGGRRPDKDNASERLPIPHFGAFAAMMARQVTKLDRLAIWNAEWRSCDMHPDVLLHLSAFTSITWLSLHVVSFPTLTTFGRLIYSLPSLHHLRCSNLTFSSTYLDPHHFLLKRASVSKLEELELDGDGINHVIDFIVAAGLAPKLVYVQLGYWYPIFICNIQAIGAQKLLDLAGNKLQKFDISLTATSVEQDVVDTTTANKDSPTALSFHHQLTFAPNSRLNGLIIRMRIHSAQDKGAYAWLNILLSQLTTHILRKLTFWIDIRQSTSEIRVSSVPRLDTVLAVLNPEQCLAIDEVLSRKQFASLIYVRFNLWVDTGTASGSLSFTSPWEAQLAHRFPKLKERGILFTPVVVDHRNGQVGHTVAVPSRSSSLCSLSPNEASFTGAPSSR